MAQRRGLKRPTQDSQFMPRSAFNAALRGVNLTTASSHIALDFVAMRESWREIYGLNEDLRFGWVVKIPGSSWSSS